MIQDSLLVCWSAQYSRAVTVASHITDLISMKGPAVAALAVATAACCFVLVSSQITRPGEATISPLKRTRQQVLQELVLENTWKNDFVMWMFPESAREQWPHSVQTWVRCMILTWAVYFSVGAVWCYYIYFCFGDKFFAPGTIPAAKDIVSQMRVSAKVRRHSCFLVAFFGVAIPGRRTAVLGLFENFFYYTRPLEMHLGMSGCFPWNGVASHKG